MLNSTLAAYIERHERVLQDLLNQQPIPAPQLRKALEYVLFSAGKRIRPLLIYACGEVFHLPLACLDIMAAAIEMMHTYSLVHDDLPAMDNDDLRRGRPTCHRAFDEATAILVGDGLQAFAFELLSQHLPNHLNFQQTITIIQELAHACGPSGMVSGQSLDLLTLKEPGVSASQIEAIHQLKTGRLILVCINMVLVAASPSAQESIALRQFAQHLGILFQMQDDYLDQFGAKNALGKGRSSDLANHKQTFANVCSQSSLADLIQQHIQQAKQTLEIFHPRSDSLHALLTHIQNRM
jgi:farnesyl diphosphate synthase